MDTFKTTFSGTVDLDDKATYPEEWLTMSTYTLWRKAWLRASESLFYMRFINPEFFNGAEQNTQVLRVWKLCDELVKIWKDKVIEDTPANRLKLMKWIYRFEDETENQVKRKREEIMVRNEDIV